MRRLSLSEWASIGELIASTGVIISIVFLGFSIRQNTDAVQAENDNVIYEMTDAWWKEFIDKPELQLIYEKKYRGESLTDIESGTLNIHTTRLLNTWELTYARYKVGLLPAAQWEMYDRAQAGLLEYYVPREMWNNDKKGFATEFAKYVDGLYERD